MAYDSVIVLMSSIGIVFLNFTFVYIFDFPVTLGTICLFVVLLFSCKNLKINRNYFIVSFFLLSYPFVLFPALELEFFKTYAQYVLFIFSLFIGTATRPWGENATRFCFNCFSFLLVLIGSYSLLQLLELNIFGTRFLLNPFGTYSPVGPGLNVYTPHELAPILRPNVFYSEPSVLGWLISLLIAGILSGYFYGYVRSKKTIVLLSLGFAGAISTVSLSGILNSLALLLVAISFYLDKERGLGVKVLLVVLPFILIVIVIYSGLLDRLENIFTEGSSVYFRVTAPLNLVSDSLFEFPFGVPLGSVEYIESKNYMVNWAGGSHTNIDNSFFYLIYHFGFLGIVFSLSLLLTVAKMLLYRDRRVFITLSLLMCLSETGALFSPNMILLIFIFSQLIKSVESRGELWNQYL